MSQEDLLVREMAGQCLRLSKEMDEADSSMPTPLQSAHIRWMCIQVDQHADDWPLAKLHRWVGFIQCALLANGVLDLHGLKSMFDKAKVAYGDMGEDLFDHLNPDSAFELDIGGQG
jgi:hypothetical protein